MLNNFSLSEGLFLLLLDPKKGILMGEFTKVIFSTAIVLDTLKGKSVLYRKEDTSLSNDNSVFLPKNSSNERWLLGHALFEDAKSIEQHIREISRTPNFDAILSNSLCKKGAIKKERSKILGCIPRTTWKESGNEYKRAITRSIINESSMSLVESSNHANLILLTHYSNAIDKVFSKPDAKMILARIQNMLPPENPVLQCLEKEMELIGRRLMVSVRVVG